MTETETTLRKERDESQMLCDMKEAKIVTLVKTNKALHDRITALTNEADAKLTATTEAFIAEHGNNEGMISMDTPDIRLIAACVAFCRNVPTNCLTRGLGMFVQAKMECNHRIMNNRVAEAIQILKEERV